MELMTNEQLKNVAPSVFATEPWSKVSEKYSFIPTIQIVDALREEGFFPVRASQSKSRIAGKEDFTKHMIRFRRAEDIQNFPRVVNGNAHHFFKNQPEVPELVLVNSHDRTSGYQLSAGLYRLVCSNGLVVQSSSFGDISVRHSGNVQGEVIEGSLRIIESMPLILDKMNEMKSIVLSRPEQIVYANAALELRYKSDDIGNSDAPIWGEQLLKEQRWEDSKPDLWTTFNKVQENLIKGGLRGRGKTGKRVTTRKISGVSEDIRLNKALWVLTEEMAKLHK